MDVSKLIDTHTAYYVRKIRYCTFSGKYSVTFKLFGFSERNSKEYRHEYFYPDELIWAYITTELDEVELDAISIDELEEHYVVYLPDDSSFVDYIF